MTPDIGSQLVSDYGIVGAMLAAVGYMVWELLKERRRSEGRMDDKHKEHIDDVRGLHERYNAHISEQHREYRDEMRTISKQFATSVDGLAGSVRSLSGKVDQVIDDVEDIKARQNAQERRQGAPNE